jgi:uncharacterized tellurite resistance protein B-like protein
MRVLNRYFTHDVTNITLERRSPLSTNETWTRAHDLALLLITVGYSSEADLSNDEFDVVVESITEWRPDDTLEQVREIVFEAVSVFQTSDVDEEVARSIRSLKTSLSPAQREKALRNVMAVAEADGIIQDNERSLLIVLGDIWETGTTSNTLLSETDAEAEMAPEWSVLHDICLVYIVLSHGSDGNLAKDELAAIESRLAYWQPELDEDGIRGILRDTLQFYSTGPSKEDISDSTDAVKEHLTKAQRVAVVNDLVYIGEIDGELSKYETDMIEQLAILWDVEIRTSDRS